MICTLLIRCWFRGVLSSDVALVGYRLRYQYFFSSYGSRLLVVDMLLGNISIYIQTMLSYIKGRIMCKTLYSIGILRARSSAIVFTQLGHQKCFGTK